ncbi:MAG: hypothetical protein ABIF71_06225 [Planctomycetota bacterium]
MMWYKNRRALAAVAGVLLLAGIWNAYNIASFRAIRAEERKRGEEADALAGRICADPAQLDPGLLYIDAAIQRQTDHLARLDREVGVWLRESLFMLPADYLPAAQQSPKVFFNEKSGDVRSELIKKAEAGGFRINGELPFGDADDRNIRECASMLYLVRRVTDTAITCGLAGLESLRQKPVEHLASPGGLFDFEVFNADMAFTGKPENILRFLDRLQAVEAGVSAGQRVFSSAIVIEAGDRLARIDAAFALVAPRGRRSAAAADQSRTGPGAPVGAGGTPPAPVPHGVPLGI